MEWSRDICLVLIDLYESFPELWNPQDSCYYNKTKKHEAWNTIAETLNCSREDIRRKMDSLLSSFRREKSKCLKNVNTGKGRHRVYVSRWFAFDRLRFLLDKDEASKETINSSITSVTAEDIKMEDLHMLTQEEEIPSSCPSPDDLVAHASMESSNVTNYYHEPETTQPTPTNQCRAKKKRKPEDEPSNILQSTVAQDGCSVFGQHISNKLRAYDHHTRNKVEYYINTVLYHVDMGYSELQIVTSQQNSSESSKKCSSGDDPENINLQSAAAAQI